MARTRAQTASSRRTGRKSPSHTGEEDQSDNDEQSRSDNGEGEELGNGEGEESDNGEAGLLDGDKENQSNNDKEDQWDNNKTDGMDDDSVMSKQQAVAPALFPQHPTRLHRPGGRRRLLFRLCRLVILVSTLFWPISLLVQLLLPQTPIAPPCHVAGNPNDLPSCALLPDVLRALNSFPRMNAADDLVPLSAPNDYFIRDSGLMSLVAILEFNAEFAEPQEHLAVFESEAHTMQSFFARFITSNPRADLLAAFTRFAMQLREDLSLDRATRAFAAAEDLLVELREKRREIHSRVQQVTPNGKAFEEELHRLRTRLFRVLVAEASATCWKSAEGLRREQKTAWLEAMNWKLIELGGLVQSRMRIRVLASILHTEARKLVQEFETHVSPDQTRSIVRDCAKHWAREQFGYCFPECPTSWRCTSKRQSDMAMHGLQSGNLSFFDPSGLGCVSHPSPVWWSWHNAVPVNVLPYMESTDFKLTPDHIASHWSRYLGHGKRNDERPIEYSKNGSGVAVVFNRDAKFYPPMLDWLRESCGMRPGLCA